MSTQENEKKVPYTKPQILDLGPLDATYGAPCTGNGNTAEDCSDGTAASVSCTTFGSGYVP